MRRGIEELGTEYTNFEFFDFSQTRSDCQYFVVQKEATTLFVFRGTSSKNDVLNDFHVIMRPLILPNGATCSIHAGFLQQFRVAKDTIVNRVGSSTHIICTGHSLGGAVASVCSLYIKALYPNKRVECVTFGSPRVGDIGFVNEFDRLVDHSDRIVNGNDPVASIRSIFSLTRYKHVKGMLHISNSSTWTSWLPKVFGNIRDHKATQYRLSLENPSSTQWREMDYKSAFWGALIVFSLLVVVYYGSVYSWRTKPKGTN